MTVALEGEMVRENVLRELASRAAKDPEFLERARRDLEGTLARYGYHLTDEETRAVRNLRRQSAGMSAEELAGALAAGLAGRDGDPPLPARRTGLARYGTRKTGASGTLMATGARPHGPAAHTEGGTAPCGE